MNLNGLPIIGGAAASSLTQRGVSKENETKEADNQSRRAASDHKADQAAGIGTTEGDAKAGDRDADGRRLWERQEAPAEASPDEHHQEHSSDPPPSRDPEGVKGSQLDLQG